MFKDIVHIATDEKFIPSALVQFEKASPFPNQFFIRVKTTEAYQPQHVPPKPQVHFKTKKELVALAKTLTPTSLVVFHSLPSVFFDIVLALPKNIQTIWMCFGYEVYNDPHYFSTQKLLGKETKNYYQGPKPKFWEPFLRKLHRNGFKNSKKQQAIRRIDYVGTAFQEEFEAIQKYTKTNKAFFYFWYYPLELIVETEEAIVTDRPNILIGNSASITNNHLEAFRALQHFTFSQDSKLLVPFSYSFDYHSPNVKKIGHNSFGDAVVFLEEFMSLPQYNTLLKSCGIAIFCNKRQQAIGNTIALLWYGAKVFLSPENPFYQFLKRKKVCVFQLNEMETQTLLTTEEILYNRTILKSFLAAPMLEEKLRSELVNIALS